MFYRIKESGKAISAGNASKIQDIHDSSADLGAGCGLPIWSGIYESARMFEAALPTNTSHDALRGHIQNALKDHLGVKNVWDENGPWVHSTFPDHVVYDHKGDTYKQKYSVKYGGAGSDPAVSFSGDPKKVHVAFVDSKDQDTESMRILTDVPANWEEVRERFISKSERDSADAKDFAGKNRSFPILEASDVEAALKSIGRAGSDNHDAATLKKNILKIAKRKGFAIPQTDQESVTVTLQQGEVVVSEGVTITMVAKEGDVKALPKPIDIKIIGPGWGSMAFYSKKMIQESGPEAFKAGTQMFWNHATESQEAERPEGNLNDLAAILVEGARWDDNGAKGPGLYAKAKVFSDYSQQVAEKGPHIGVSINAGIKCHEGEAEGKSGRIADKFVHAFSADFVTKAGAGGAPIVPVTESDRRTSPEKETITMLTEAEIKALQDKQAVLEAENANLREGQNKFLAVATVGTVLKEAGIDYSTKLLERVCANPVMKEGKVDPDWVRGIVADLSEGQTAQITGLGPVKEGARKAAAGELTEAETKAFKESLKDLGVPEAGLDIAYTGGR